MNAKGANKAIGLLDSLGQAADLSAFTDDRILSTAQQLKTASSNPDRSTAYCNALHEHQYISVLSKAVTNGLKLLQGRSYPPEQQICIAVTELCELLGNVMVSSTQWMLNCPSTDWKDAVQTLIATGALKVTISCAKQLTAALDSYCSLQDTQHQQLQEQHIIEQCRLAHGIMKIFGGVTKHPDHALILSHPAVAETLQPAAALALAAVRCAHNFWAAGAVPKPVQVTATEALDVACVHAETIDNLTEVLLSLPNFTPAPCVEPFLASSELQQLLLVYVGSLTAGLHKHKKGVHQVNISGSGEASMQLEVPPWHEHALAELGAGVAGQLVPASLAILLGAAGFAKTPKTDSYLHQLSRAMNAATHALECGGSSSTQQLQERMLLPLLRLLVEAAALLSDVTATNAGIMCSQALLRSSSIKATRLDVPTCGGSRPSELSRVASINYQCKRIPPSTAAGILPPMLNLVVPAVLHVLKLDSRTALQEYRKLYNYANEEQLAIGRLSLISNMTNLLSILTRSFQPKHLASAVFHKPLTSLSIFEASIRSEAAESIAPSSQNTSLGEFSKFITTQAADKIPFRQLSALEVAIQVLVTCKEAVQSGKLASVLAAPPLGMQQQQWAGMLLRQLSSLLVTCLKIPNISIRSAAGAWADIPEEVHIGVVGDILSSVVQVGQLAPVEQQSADVASGTQSGASRTNGRSWVAEFVALSARCLWVLGKCCRAAAEDMQADPEFAAVAGSLGATDLYRTAVLCLLAPVVVEAQAAIEWLAGQLRMFIDALPGKVQKQLQEQHVQLRSTLQVVPKVQGVADEPLTALQVISGAISDPLRALQVVSGEPPTVVQEQLLAEQLPQLLMDYGSTIAAWVPQQQFCHNLGCVNLTMLGESALVQGQGKVCAGCCAVRYCGKECQAQDWNSRHKSACKSLKATAVAKGSKA